MSLIFVMETDDEAARAFAVELLEEGKWYDMGKGWMARTDPPHPPNTQPHTHVYLRGNEVFVINKDGTSSHNSDLSGMPSKILTGLKRRGLVEARLLELAGLPHLDVPGNLMATLLRQVDSANRVAGYAEDLRK